MDSSDILRKKQARAVYIFYRDNVLVKQPNCNRTTCNSNNGCVLNYPSYQVRQQVTVGQQDTNNCTNTGCGCQG